MKKEEILEMLSAFCRSSVEAEGDLHVFPLRSRSMRGRKLTLADARLEEIMSELSDLSPHEETALISSNSYEVVVKDESAIPVRGLREDKIEVANIEAGLHYELSSASDPYIIWMLSELRDKIEPGDLRTEMFYIPSLLRRIEQDEEISPLEYIRSTTFRWLTLKIRSEKPCTPASLTRLSYSLLFHIAYNLDVSLVPQRLIEEMVRSGRINRMRRSRAEEIDPPRRIYNDDLVQHYLLAVSTDNPVIEYLSYYHILEHHFESVYNDDLITAVRNSLTNPGFSYKRRKDIDMLIKSVRKSMQIRSETITFSESEALRLCIERFVSFADLVDKLNAYDETLVDYYKCTKVDFSGGVNVDLLGKDSTARAKMLAKRIYFTRNALVHSKEGEKSRYTPFKDDRTLVKEVPLLRFISEMAILAESVVQ